MKQIVYLALTITSLIILVFTAVMLQRVDPSQKQPDFEPYDFPDTLANKVYDLDSITAIIGDNKGLPEGFELAASIAYSAYPQLKNVHIDMILINDGVPMEASFNIFSLFGPKKNRQYRILLNNNEKSTNPILLRELPFDAQVGILAHELGHIVYYHRLNTFQIAKWGINYLRSDTYSATHERTTDLMAVYHGLGSQIYQYAHYVRHSPSCQSFYARHKGWMDKFYMTDKELLKAINE